MDASDLTAAMDVILPDSKIIQDVQAILDDQELENPRVVAFEDGDLFIPENAPLEVIGKTFCSWKYQAAYGHWYYQVMVAIGKAQDSKMGWVDAELCFITIMYDPDGNILTTHWHRSWFDN